MATMVGMVRSMEYQRTVYLVMAVRLTSDVVVTELNQVVIFQVTMAIKVVVAVVAVAQVAVDQVARASSSSGHTANRWSTAQA
jgi:hypothetical protein